MSAPPKNLLHGVGPGWVGGFPPHFEVMQMLCFEATNMAVPVLLPDLRLMSRQSSGLDEGRCDGGLGGAERFVVTNLPVEVITTFEKNIPNML